MKTLVTYYSYSGKSRKLAEAFAESDCADITEIKDLYRPNVLGAYTKGCYNAIKGFSWEIWPLKLDWSAYDRVVLYSPVWAGNPPPAVNAFLGFLPSGKSVVIHMVSASGKCKCQSRIEAAVKMKGSTPIKFDVIKNSQ